MPRRSAPPRKSRRTPLTIQYTIRGVSKELDQVARAIAKRDGISLNQALMNALRRGLDLAAEPVRHNDLDRFIGTWVEDPAFDEAIEAQRQIDPELWK